MPDNIVKQAMDNQVRNLEEKSGKAMSEWVKIVQASGLEKHGEMVSFLKENHGLGHGNANMIVHHAKQSHAGFSEDDALISEQYKGKENLKAWYDKLMKEVTSFGTDVDVSPKKAYVSLRRKKQFAIIQPSTKGRLDIGLNIKDEAPEGKLEAAGSWNTMCTHRVKVENEKDLDSNVIQWLKKAYEQAG